ncbi:uncharacterized protein FOMMEDRAFT_137000 [Fomitiporia mediterranea MF3/22]|uniref:uncharacterized protein n=1 Tax=Fomitiporia mediterranea (strain MF3/22) TaxID=694068 RepID=UPI0004407B00|nr:uncharacterized protein FOMMEDRAFT_137000 [Fomitiporia mediterranea MF3/22]EJC98347.1 hypothetical protein FOMMEDRAFT_137000 [Fomitiporia mediterranea MF3/22]
MELSREAYQLIVQNVKSRSDLCTLTRTSRAFQRAAERALYNTLVMNDSTTAIKICHSITSNPRLGALVDALTIFASPPTRDDEDDSSDNGVVGLPEEYWKSIASVLAQTTRLRHLNVHVDGDSAFAWILRNIKFRLDSFHCDLAWDEDLVNFLNSQDQLRDLYLADFALTSPTPIRNDEEEEDDGQQAQPSSPMSIRPDALPLLSILECSFIDAITTLVPGRPVIRVKTCFSREDTPGKAEELRKLSASLRRTSSRLRSLDLADASYTEEFTLTVLGTMTGHLPDLRYFGTLVLPVGLERLQFFGLLMRLKSLYTVELEVSEWEPAPSPQAMRALASELRLYCPSIRCFVFVQEFERTVVRVVNGFCAVDPEANTENLWRDERS